MLGSAWRKDGAGCFGKASASIFGGYVTLRKVTI